MKSTLFIFLFCLSQILFSQSKLSTTWQLGYHENINDKPAKFYPSTVPGAPQLDIMYAENYKQPIWYADNVKQFLWMEKTFFTYKTKFNKPDLKTGQTLFFHSKGIDYEFFISLNGSKIFEQEGMFRYVNLDLTPYLKNAENELTITILPPKMAGSDRPKDELNINGFFRDNARTSFKPPMSYGWDWHPRLISRGIWDETYLEVRNNTFFEQAELIYRLDSIYKNASIKVEFSGKNLKGSTYNWSLKSPSGSLVLSKSGIVEEENFKIVDKLSNVSLWWPNGYGEPNLYTSIVEIKTKEGETITKSQKVGFRRSKIVMGEGTWIEPTIFPKSRSVSPMTIEINGKVIFAKGSNWVPNELFPGIQNRENYEPYVKWAKEANFNILRSWGGQIINKESFFDLCDEHGILVWQEFPLTGTNYPDTDQMIEVTKLETEAIVKRVRKHASLAFWSGGNELFNEWSGMTEQSIVLRTINAKCLELDPYTPFIYTSPLEGMGHGHYVFWEPKNGGEVFQWMPKGKNKYTAYSEFGVPSVANVEELKKFIPANELFPPKPGTAWETHHAFGVWGINRWIELPFLNEYFGEIKSLEELVSYSQLTQCEGYKCIFEEARRQKPFCGMAVNWCYQEPWPCAANNSLITWPGKKKPSFDAVKNALRPVLASARFQKFRYDPGEIFTAELYILNDTYNKISPALVKVKLIYDGNKEMNLLNWDFPGTSDHKNFEGPTAKTILPKMNSPFFKIKLEVEGKPEYNSEYTFIYRAGKANKIKYLNGVTE
jgi:beta-mannosidase